VNLLERQLVTAGCIMRDSLFVPSTERSNVKEALIMRNTTDWINYLWYGDLQIWMQKFTWRHSFQAAVLVLCLLRWRVFFFSLRS